MLYGIKYHLHKQKFVCLIDTQNGMLFIVQSDCDVINHHLNEKYNFDIISNAYKYYLPNLMRHTGYVEKQLKLII